MIQRELYYWSNIWIGILKVTETDVRYTAWFPVRELLNVRCDTWMFSVGSFWNKIKSLGLSTENVQVSYHTFISSLAGNRGTGVIASSRTFRPRPGRVIRDLLRQLHAAWHAMVRKH